MQQAAFEAIKDAESSHELKDAAFEAIKVAELEISGIRDGDSCWHGGDVLGHTWADLANLDDHTSELRSLVDCLEAAYDAEWRAQPGVLPGDWEAQH